MGELIAHREKGREAKAEAEAGERGKERQSSIRKGMAWTRGCT